MPYKQIEQPHPTKNGVHQHQKWGALKQKISILDVCNIFANSLFLINVNLIWLKKTLYFSSFVWIDTELSAFLRFAGKISVKSEEKENNSNSELCQKVSSPQHSKDCATDEKENENWKKLKWMAVCVHKNLPWPLFSAKCSLLKLKLASKRNQKCSCQFLTKRNRYCCPHKSIVVCFCCATFSERVVSPTDQKRSSVQHYENKSFTGPEGQSGR